MQISSGSVKYCLPRVEAAQTANELSAIALQICDEPIMGRCGTWVARRLEIYLRMPIAKLTVRISRAFSFSVGVS